LLDEPIGHLDARVKFTTQTALKRLAGQLETTIIYVTHDYREALGLSDKVAVLRKGVIEQIAKPEEIYFAPDSDFVARLIGEPPTNLIDGEMITQDGKIYFNAGVFTIEVSGDSIESMEKVAWQEGNKRMVRIGIRHSFIRVSREKRENNSFQLPVYAIIHGSTGSIASFELPDTFLEVGIDRSDNFSMSEKVWIDFDKKGLLFFRKTLKLSKA
jgi:ABC-type sugar transport system ATPase subunit